MGPKPPLPLERLSLRSGGGVAASADRPTQEVAIHNPRGGEGEGEKEEAFAEKNNSTPDLAAYSTLPD